MARFALLKHDHPFDHFDLLLQREESLKSWRLVSIPRAGEPQSATVIPDHRLMYLDYEGPVSSNRGHVQRVDGGELQWLHAGEDQVEVAVS
ncbi:MAG: DNA polymerase ligase N-terminal domain-containing protein, partial [Gemmataceae bacterium]